MVEFSEYIITMTTFKNIAGHKFGRLVAIEPIKKLRGSRIRTFWKCKCECGKFCEPSLDELRSGDTKSCGCLKIEKNHLPDKNLIGQKFGKLTVIDFGGYVYKENKFAWMCRCDCGEITIVDTNNLTSGGTKSCSCWRYEATRVLPPKEQSIKRVWRGGRYNDANISVEKFLQLSQLNCYYCNIPPSKVFNYGKTMKLSQVTIKEADFIYNGLDRIDSSKKHIIDNVVPCCIECNVAKRCLSIDEFYNLISNLYNRLNSRYVNKSIESVIITEEQFNKHGVKHHNKLISAIKRAWKRNYDDGDISIINFYNLSQFNCYYCDKEPNNLCQGVLKYNGLDRIDSSKGHYINNVVPCCRDCNWAKNDSTLEEFNSWIKRTYEHLFSCGRLAL